jgi:hypothetical protein
MISKMPTLPIEISPTMEREYLALPEAEKRQLSFELVFRLGQFSGRSKGSDSLKATFERSRAEAKKNGITENMVNELLNDVGHAA